MSWARVSHAERSCGHARRHQISMRLSSFPLNSAEDFIVAVLSAKVTDMHSLASRTLRRRVLT